MQGIAAPSPWVVRWASLLPPGAAVLDVACGAGRHARWLHGHGFVVTAVDRDAAAIEALAAVADAVVADLEGGPWPFAGRRFDAVVVTNYLWRPLLETIVRSVADHGWLIYETFAEGQQTVGRPSRPAFLLQRGELLRVASDLRVVAFEDGFSPAQNRFVQRIAARREPADPTAPPRHPID